MVTEIEANFIGCAERSFQDRKGSTVRYRKLNFLCHGEQTPVSMSVRYDVELGNLSPFDGIVLTIDWYYNGKTGFWNPRIVNVVSNG